MAKIPKIALAVIFILLFGLVFFVGILVELAFTKSTYDINFSVWEYRVAFFIIGIIAFFIGVIFLSIQKCWTMENLADRIDNGIAADHMIYLIKLKKAKMGWSDDVEIKVIQKGK